MKKVILVFSMVAFLFGSLVFTSCGGSDTTSNDNDTTKSDSVVVSHQPGETPFDFPTVGTSAQAGEYVLAPSASFIDDAWEDVANGSTPSFIFYSAKMVTPGDKESIIHQTSGDVTIPNSLIIPIPAGQEAHVGDIVLTWWQSGSGMEKAIVIDDANPKQPTVVYLDASYDENGDNEEQLKENSFVVISNEWAPGTSIAVQGDYDMNHWNVIRVEGNKVLAEGWAGSMGVFDKSKCTAIPVKMDVAVGDEIQIPYIGSYQVGTVTKVDELKGRVWVDTEWGGEIVSEPVCFGDFTTGLSL